MWSCQSLFASRFVLLLSNQYAKRELSNHITPIYAAAGNGFYFSHQLKIFSSGDQKSSNLISFFLPICQCSYILTGGLVIGFVFKLLQHSQKQCCMLQCFYIIGLKHIYKLGILQNTSTFVINCALLLFPTIQLSVYLKYITVSLLLKLSEFTTLISK